MLSRLLSAVSLLLVALVSQTDGEQITSYTLCGSPLTGVGEVLEVHVTPCDPHDGGGCKLYRNSTVEIKIVFKPNANSTTLTHRVHGSFWNVAVKYNALGPADACSKLGSPCPLQGDQEYSYVNTFFVNLTYPAINLYVRWQLVTDGNVIQVCILIPVKISPPKST